MMHVKILSMQRVINYGSFMQAYALKKIIESYGHRVEFSDFEPGEPRHHSMKVRPITRAERLLNLVKMKTSPKEIIESRIFRKKVRECFENVAWPLLDIGEEKNLDYSGDLLVVGSDEVFNYTQNHAMGYVPAFFGHDVAATSIISYAASAGYANVEDVVADGMVNEISTGLSKFRAISVRDQNTHTIVSRYSKKVPTLVLDPTLVYDFSAEVRANRGPLDQPEYLLVYAYADRLDSPEEIAAIREYAQSKGLKIVSAGCYHGWCDENVVVTPFELLSLFERATSVVTDTFHGTIFSVIYRKPFVSFVRKKSRISGNSNKLGFLLRQLGLESRVVSVTDNLQHQINLPIDYDQVFDKIAYYREISLEFIEKSLQRAEKIAKGARTDHVTIDTADV